MGHSCVKLVPVAAMAPILGNCANALIVQVDVVNMEFVIAPEFVSVRSDTTFRQTVPAKPLFIRHRPVPVFVYRHRLFCLF